MSIACVIIFATTVGATVEIRNHELAHCNGWSHAAGMDKSRGFGKAYKPPRRFLHAFKGNVYETPVTEAEARQRCRGMLGCSLLIKE